MERLYKRQRRIKVEEPSLEGISDDYDSCEVGEKRIRETCRKSGLLENPEFLEKYPFIIKVAEILDDCSDIHTRITGEFKIFKLLDVKNINDYLLLLAQRNRWAIKVYRQVRKAYGYKSSDLSQIKREPVTIPLLPVSYDTTGIEAVVI